MEEIKKPAVKRRPAKKPVAAIVEAPKEKPEVVEACLGVDLSVFDGQEIEAVGIFRPAKSKNLISYLLTIKNGVVTKAKIDEPEERLIAEDNAKVIFVHKFLSGGL